MSRGGVETMSAGAGPSAFNGSLDFISFDLGAEEGKAKREASPSRRDRGESGGRPQRGAGARNGDGARLHPVEARKRKFEDRHGTFGEKSASNGAYVPPSKRKKQKWQDTFGTPWCSTVNFERCSNATEMLHDELIAFTDWIAPAPKEHEARQMVIQLIRRAIVQEWPDARVEAFGSQSTQLYMPQGDIDLVVVSEAMETQRREGVLRKMAALLRRHNLATEVLVIARAKVPIVKFVCTYGKLSVDISVNQTNGIDASHYVRDWLADCPPLRPLIMAVKLLLSQRGLSEVFSGGLGSYSVICMVISHMQLHPKLQRGEIEASLNLGIMLLDFLELFGKNFGYDDVGISVTGRGSYFRKASKGWRDDRRPFMLSVEDPLDPSNDISKGSFAIGQVRSAFSGAFDILSAALCQKANHMAHRQARQHWGNTEEVDEDEAARREIENGVKRGVSKQVGNHPDSLLGSIFSITREMFKQKRDLEELWEGGTLQHRLGRPPPGRSPEPSSYVCTPYGSDDGAMAATKKERSTKGGGTERKANGNYSTSTGAQAAAGRAGKPAVFEDDSGRGARADDDDDSSVVMMNEEELAASQGIQFSSSSMEDKSSSEHDGHFGGRAGFVEEDDSRYRSTRGGQRKEGGLTRSRLDAFAERAPRTFVDDDDRSSDNSDADKRQPVSATSAAAGVNGRVRRSSSAEARRSRKNAFWATKGNTVGTGALSPDDGEDDDDDQDVVLNFHDWSDAEDGGSQV